MTSNQNDTPVIGFRTKKRINGCVRATMATLDNENLLVPDSPNVLLQRALKVFAGLKPLLAFLSAFPVLPQLWRTGITSLVQVLDSLAAIGSDVTLQFKAGRDLNAAPELNPAPEFKAGRDLDPAA